MVSAQGGVWLGGVCRGGLPGGVCPRRGCLPPCEQNHRRLWKHNLAATTLRTVMNSWTYKREYLVNHRIFWENDGRPNWSVFWDLTIDLFEVNPTEYYKIWGIYRICRKLFPVQDNFPKWMRTNVNFSCTFWLIHVAYWFTGNYECEFEINNVPGSESGWIPKAHVNTWYST